MKLGFFCESPADQAALAVFAEGILGERPEPINMDLEARSVPGLFGALDAVIRGLHYNSDADGLVVIVDSDESDLHDSAHDRPEAECGSCRYCRIRKTIESVCRHLRPRAGRAPLKFAIGLAVPAIEAWYLVGRQDPRNR